MTAIAIEIADVGLNAAGESGPLGAASPGYAVLERGDVRVGEAARAASRLKPRHASHRFWDQLDQQPVGRPFPRSLRHADLAYAHLSTYWSGLKESLQLSLPRTSVLLAVPSALSPTQLSLLLGVARACDIPVTGLVDAPLAALDGASAGQTVLHLELHLHRAVWTAYQTNGQRARKRVDSVEGVGLMSLQSIWTRCIAAQFVRQTRFDPLHGAASEQTLYDHLPGWLAQINGDGGAVLTLETRGQEHSAEVDLNQLVAAAESHLGPILESGSRLLEADPSAQLVLSSCAAQIPGLTGRLAGLSDAEPLALAEGAAAQGTLRRREVIEEPGTELPLVLSLPTMERHG